MNLTDEEIRIKVAEAMGWERCPADHKVWRTPQQRDRNIQLIGHKNGPWSYGSSGPPNYPLDLNACAEFENTLTDRELWQIDAILFNLPDCRAPFVATARQRCLAYLKTKGLIP